MEDGIECRYLIFQSSSIDKVEGEVNAAIDRFGFEPHGAPFIYQGCVCQAVYRPERMEIDVGSIDWEVAEINLDIDKH